MTPGALPGELMAPRMGWPVTGCLPLLPAEATTTMPAATERSAAGAGGAGEVHVDGDVCPQLRALHDAGVDDRDRDAAADVEARAIETEPRLLHPGGLGRDCHRREDGAIRRQGRRRGVGVGGDGTHL